MYKAKDFIGRVWGVRKETVLADYVKFLMREDNLSQEDATIAAMEDGFPEYWWYEQFVPYPDYVIAHGLLLEDISDERKRELLNGLATRSMIDIE